LAIQSQTASANALPMPRRLLAATGLVALLVLVQIALGGWVSTNYAVLACRDFPTCQESWWPPMDFEAGFSLRRGLGVSADGAFLPFPALTAIHQAHRIGAAIVLGAIALLAWRMHRRAIPELRRWAWALVAAGAWQLTTGLSNVVLDWPLAAAVAHTGGAAALAVLVTVVLARARPQVGPRHLPAPVSAKAAS
jgi:cytochrome c oxidase assembly protein subunit 15